MRFCVNKKVINPINIYICGSIAWGYISFLPSSTYIKEVFSAHDTKGQLSGQCIHH